MERKQIMTHVAYGRYGESRFVAVKPPLSPQELSKMAIDGFLGPATPRTSRGEGDDGYTVLYVNGNQHGNTPDLRSAEERDISAATSASRITAWLTNHRDTSVNLQAGVVDLQYETSPFEG